MPTVDILLATYEGAAFLPEQLASLDAQTHRDWRLFLRDDGSSDGSPDIVRDWAARTGRELVVVDDGDVRVGPAESFGRLLERSDAPYFAFCDQDDVWEPEKLSLLLDAAEGARGGPVLAHCDLSIVDKDLVLVAPSLWRLRRNNAEIRRAAPGYRSHLLFQNQVTGCAMLGDAALRSAVAPVPDEASMHDWWAAIAAAHLGEIVLVNKPLVRYRQHGGNVYGAQSRTLGALMAKVLRRPVQEAQRTRADYRRRARQAAAALERFGGSMTVRERRFARDLANLGSGLAGKGGLRLLLWALRERRRWPLAIVIAMETWRR